MKVKGIKPHRVRYVLEGEYRKVVRSAKAEARQKRRAFAKVLSSKVESAIVELNNSYPDLTPEKLRHFGWQI